MIFDQQILVENQSKKSFENKKNLDIEPTRKIRTIELSKAIEKIKSLETKISNMEKQLNSKKDKKLIENQNEGNFYAILIANYKYEFMNNLKTPEKDVDELNRILKSKYGFETYVFKNANRKKLVAEITKLNSQISSNDHLLIYYAGHGHLDMNEGFGCLQTQN